MFVPSPDVIVFVTFIERKCVQTIFESIRYLWGVIFTVFCYDKYRKIIKKQIFVYKMQMGVKV